VSGASDHVFCLSALDRERIVEIGQKPYILISSDCHAGAPPSVYRDYLEARYRDSYDAWLDRMGIRRATPQEEVSSLSERVGGLELDPFGVSIRQSFSSAARVSQGAVQGTWDPAVRTRELDAAGVAGEVIFPDGQRRNGYPFASGDVNSIPVELRVAGIHAHNRWLADLCSVNPGRHAGIALVDLTDIDQAIQDTRQAREVGLFGGVLLPPLWITLREPTDFWHHPRFEPFWATCEALDMPVNVHVGGGGGAIYGDSPSARWINSMETFWATSRPVSLFLWSGILERHPDLKLVITEAGGSWVPGMLAAMEYLYDNRNPEAARANLPRRPSEYWHRQCFIGASPPADRFELTHRDEIGIGNLMWGNDYPHVEGTWSEDNLEGVSSLIEGISDEDAAAFLGQTAIQVYGFDATLMSNVAARLRSQRTSVSAPQPSAPRTGMA
jgi:predicted TIM-barrel fold metal-dependent hydrolase